MTHGPSNAGTGITESSGVLLDSIADRFESAWKSGDAPSIERFLAEAPESAQRALLVELIRVDLEFRWRSAGGELRGSRAASDAALASESRRRGDQLSPDAFVVEDYLQRFPELSNDGELLAALASHEYRVRQLWGDRPSHDVYLRRFPQLEKSINDALAEVDRQVRAERDAATVEFIRNSETEIPRNSIPAKNLPDFIGKYRVISVLDSGGQAVVYRAIHPTLERELVVKIARQAGAYDEANKQRLVAEGRLLADLNHPNLARIFDLDFHEGRPFLVMEYLRGRNLFQATRAAPPSAPDAARLVAKVARALAHAHARGVLHKDIKPHNVLIDDSGEPRLIDFGLAQLQHAWAPHPGKPESLSGTAQFMAPEQAASEIVDERSDIFAAGALLYYLLVGKPPFQGADLKATLDLARRCDFDREVLKGNRVDAQLAAICLKAMSANPADRYRSADDLASDLERTGQQPSRASRAAIGPLGRVAALIATACLATGVLVTALWRNLPSERQGSEVPARGNAPVPPSIGVPLSIQVQRNNRVNDLEDIAPLQTGDVLQIAGELPPGLQCAVFWFDAEGKVSERPAEMTVSNALLRMTSPSSTEGTTLEGAAGTEVIVLCASSDGKPSLSDIEKLVGAGQPWPPLRQDAVVTFSRDEVRMASATRAPGESSVMAGADALRKADAFRKALAEKYEFVSGVAFPHVDVNDSPIAGPRSL